MTRNAVLFHHPDGVDTSRPNLMGRHAAGEGFLQGFARHAGVDAFYAQTLSAPHFDDFKARIAATDPSGRPVHRVPPGRMSDSGVPPMLWMPSPSLGPLAWRRRSGDARRYSIAGVNHTIASDTVMNSLGELLTAPLEAWDALVCTSNAVKSTIETVLEHWRGYLGERLEANPRLRPQLPVIPLGVDCDRFDNRDGKADHDRSVLRAGLGIGPDDVAVLYVGRLSFHAKSHPISMYIALEEAAQRSGLRIHLIQAGWFANTAIERQFRDAAKGFAPSVNAIFLDGRDAKVRFRIWRAADVFCSLSDNIQETFGLTPIEAMAAGLPCVVSDWDGYRDTVRDGVDGFCIPTWMPDAGAGGDIALTPELDIVPDMRDSAYNHYCGHVSQATAVDIDATIAAFETLFASAEKRRSIGAEARKRARSEYDWSVIVGRYQALWEELAAIRSRADEAAPAAGPVWPLKDDPFRAFAAYPTHRIDGATLIEALPGADRARIDAIASYDMNSFARATLPDSRTLAEVLAKLADGPITVDAALSDIGDDNRARTLRGIGWLAKVGLVTLKASMPKPSISAPAPEPMPEKGKPKLKVGARPAKVTATSTVTARAKPANRAPQVTRSAVPSARKPRQRLAFSAGTPSRPAPPADAPSKPDAPLSAPQPEPTLSPASVESTTVPPNAPRAEPAVAPNVTEPSAPQPVPNPTPAPAAEPAENLEAMDQETLRLRADEARQRGESDRAAQYLRQALVNDRDDPMLNVAIGELMASTGRLEPAITSFRRAVALAPEMTAAHQNLGKALFLGGKEAESIHAFRRAVQIAPDDAESRYLLGAALRRSGAVNEAVQCLRLCLDLDSSRADGAYHLALALKALDRSGEAVAAAERGLKAAPNDPFLTAVRLGIGAEDDGRARVALGEGVRIALHMSRRAHFFALRPTFDALRKAGHWPLMSADGIELQAFDPAVIVFCEDQIDSLKALCPAARLVHAGLTPAPTEAEFKSAIAADAACVSGDPHHRALVAAGKAADRVWLTGPVAWDASVQRSAKETSLPFEAATRVVVFQPHFDPSISAAPLLGTKLKGAIAGERRDIAVAILPHAVTCDHQPGWMRAWAAIAEADPNVVLIQDPSVDPQSVLARADCLLGDHGGLAHAALLTDTPVVLVDPDVQAAAAYAGRPHGFAWERRDFAERVDTVDGVGPAVSRALADRTARTEARAQARKALFGAVADGNAADRLAAALDGFAAHQRGAAE